MIAYLCTLKPGQTFTLAGSDPVRGQVLKVGSGSVLVKLEGAMEHVEIERPDGQVITFDRPRHQRVEWSRGTRVIPGEEVADVEL